MVTFAHVIAREPNAKKAYGTRARHVCDLFTREMFARLLGPQVDLSNQIAFAKNLKPVSGGALVFNGPT